MNTVFFVGICMFVNTLMCGGSAFDTQLELEVKVLSEQGTPIVGANVKGGFKKRMGAGKPVIQNFLTDTNGIAQLSAKTSGQVAVEVTQKGYYTHYEDSDYFSLLRNGAISTNQTIRLKKIKNPIPMYVKQEEREIPNTKQFFGYDFEIGDWVAPYGKGKINDVLLFPQCTVTNEYNYSVQLTVKFPGEYNGITAMPREYAYLQGSKLRSLNIAPEDGFQDSLELFRWRKERKTNKGGFSENDREGYTVIP